MATSLAQRNAELEAQNAELRARAEKLDARNKHLEAQIDALKQRLFGRRSEKLDSRQLDLFEEPLSAEAIAEIQASLEQEDESAPKQKSRRNGRKPIPKSVRRQRTVLDLSDSEKEAICGHGGTLVKFGEDVTEEVEIIPAQIFVNEIVRPKYKIAGCTDSSCQGVFEADLPPRPIEQGRPGPGLLAHIAVSKYADHLPLYRQSQMFARLGIDIHRSTMASWLVTVGFLLEPIVAAMKRTLLAGNYLQADETTIRVQGIKKGKMHTGYLWGYGIPWLDVVYDFAMGRGGEYAAKFLDGFEGHLQIDGYDGYNQAIRNSRGKISRGGCMAHVRRGFFDARNDDPERAKTVLAAIQILYRLERQWKVEGLSPEERVRARREHARPKLETLHELLEAYKIQVRPTSKLGEGIQYALNEWPYVIRYVDVGESEIDNNAIEHTVRPVAIGRKNYLFAGSPDGGKAAAIFYSLITSAKNRGINPWTYLRDVIDRISTHPQARIAELTPAGWAATVQADDENAALQD